jgi:predicted AAA+ superfamily ATPase
MIENIVYMELLFRGNRVAVGNVDGNEIDFVTFDTDKRHYYQVTSDLHQE